MVQTQFLWCYGGKKVFLMDSFSGWSERVPMVLVEGSSTIFQAFRDLPPGCHQYKFLVDNSMRVDNQQPFVKDQTLGTISNYILVPEPEFIHPTIEASSSTMDIDNNGILRSEVAQASLSGMLPLGPGLQLSANVTNARLLFSKHMSSFTTYDLLPESVKVFILDVNVNVDEAFHIMYDEELAVVPLWDAPTRKFSGMLTTSDFIYTLLKLHERRQDITIGLLDNCTISAFKEGILQVPGEVNGSSFASRQLVQAGPDEFLKDLAHRIVTYRISAIPICDTVGDSDCQSLLHTACLAGVMNHICGHLGNLKYLPLLQQPVGNLPLGTWRTNESSSGQVLLTLRSSELLVTALKLLIEARISAIPIVDEEGALYNVLTKRDIIRLAEGNIYTQIRLDGTTIAQALATLRWETRNRHHICRRSDSLYSVMERLSNPVVRRLIVTNSDGRHVEGIITLRDVFTFFLS